MENADMLFSYDMTGRYFHLKKKKKQAVVKTTQATGWGIHITLITVNL